MKIKLSELGGAGKRLKLELSPAWMKRQLEGVVDGENQGRGHADLEVHPVGNTINMAGRLKATFYVPCSRCLGPARIEVDEKAKMVFARRPANLQLPDDQELEPDDLEFAYYDGDEIDLEPVLREQLILAVPIAPFCSDTCSPDVTPEATGSEEGPVDPRWAPLLELKAKDEPGPGSK